MGPFRQVSTLRASGPALAVIIDYEMQRLPWKYMHLYRQYRHKKDNEGEIYITNIETTSLHPTEGGFISVGGGFLCNPNLSYCLYQSLDSVAGGVGSVLVGLINENRCFPKKKKNIWLGVDQCLLWLVRDR